MWNGRRYRRICEIELVPQGVRDWRWKAGKCWYHWEARHKKLYVERFNGWFEACPRKLCIRAAVGFSLGRECEQDGPNVSWLLDA